MTRTQNTPVTKRRRKRTLKRVKGENEFKNAREKLNKSLIHAYRDRKKKKSFFRQV
jgi:ribosomal protein L20